MAHGERQALQAINVDEVREMVEIEERAAEINEARMRAKRRSREAKTMGYKKLSEKEREAAKSRADLAFVLKGKRMAEAREERAWKEQPHSSPGLRRNRRRSEPRGHLGSTRRPLSNEH